jgi:CubicO group peptidase (beta-lactamase class C family)
MSGQNFIFATPESVGIPSEAICGFLKELKDARLPMHSFIVMRHGKVVAEGYAKPYGVDKNHRLYSISKSFTSIAVGMMITQGRLQLTDKVADFFPEYLPHNPSPYLMACTVRDLLVMASFNESDAYGPEDEDYVKVFFDNRQVQHMPGQVYHYDSSCTVTLGAIVEKLSGMSLVEYLRPLLDDLGISQGLWCVKTPEGRCAAGCGFSATSRDLLRLGQFVMNRGEWNGRVWVSREYMEAATSRQISCFAGGYDMANQGYGYHFRVLKDGGFACYGMGSQFVLMMPRYGTIVVTTAGTLGIADPDDMIRNAHYRMLDKCSDEALPENPQAQACLKEMSRLKLPAVSGKADSPVSALVSGRRYRVEDNIMGFSWVQFDFWENLCLFTYEKRGVFGAIPLYAGDYGPVVMPEKTEGKQYGKHDTHLRGRSSFAWIRENALVGMVYITDYALGQIKMQATFTEGQVTMMFVKTAGGFADFRDYLAGHAMED